MENAGRIARYFGGQKIFVTGGAGMIGSHLVEMLVELGARVTVPVRPSDEIGNLDAVLDRISLVQADLFERSAVDAVIGDHPIVLHLAAAKGGGIAHSMRHHGSLFRDNMLASINVLDAARDGGAKRTLVVSSACVYPRDCTTPTPEEDGVKGAPEPTNAGYGWSKRMIEYLALAYAQEYGMNVGVARPFNAYGPRDDFFCEHSHVIPGLIKRFLAGDLTVWGSGTQTRSFLYVTDFARGLLTMCAHDDVTGPLNIGSEEETSIGDLARMLRELLGIQQEIRFDTSKPDGQPRRACDTRRAREQLGYRAQVSIRDGLRMTIDWYQAEKRRRQGA
jgi:GDP-L-fucose synthase